MRMEWTGALFPKQLVWIYPATLIRERKGNSKEILGKITNFSIWFSSKTLSFFSKILH